MNYRHSYHAGNHTEVFKHSVLVLVLQHLLKKPGPFTVLDTHAGAGLYDLTSDNAEKTGEAVDGIGRVIDRDVPAASAYLDLIRRLNPIALQSYPGSPAIVQAFLREDDLLIACELRKDDAALLRANMKGDRRVSVHCRDGYAAMHAFLPPPTRRGLVFIDPPFERPDEFARLADGLNFGIQKWPTGNLPGLVSDQESFRNKTIACSLPCSKSTHPPLRAFTRFCGWRETSGERRHHL